MDELSDCVRAEWDRRGVRDGVIRVFWEIVPCEDEDGDEDRDG
jgi:hypothetical protein